MSARTSLMTSCTRTAAHANGRLRHEHLVFQYALARGAMAVRRARRLSELKGRASKREVQRVAAPAAAGGLLRARSPPSSQLAGPHPRAQGWVGAESLDAAAEVVCQAPQGPFARDLRQSAQ